MPEKNIPEKSEQDNKKKKSSYEEAMEDIAQGRVKSFDTIEELFADLEGPEE